MNKLKSFIFILFFVGDVFIYAADNTRRAEYLFIIVVNGLRYDDGLGNKNHLYTDNIWTKIRPHGTVCTNFYNSEQTYPIPAQMSLLTGVWHILENPVAENTPPAFPTLFEYWNKKSGGKTSYFASSKKNLEILCYSKHKDYGSNYAPLFTANTDTSIDTTFEDGSIEVRENAIYEKAVSYIFEHHPSFVYMNLGTGKGDEAYLYPHQCQAKDSKDSCGGEAMLNAYYESIILIDAIVYDLWERIQHDEIYKDRSVLFFLSDHGRHTNDFHGFGDGCRGCRQLNFLAAGPGIKKNHISKKKRTLIDICKTVGFLFDIPTPFAKGEIMRELLD